jgi:peptide/nickel transport system substrate-binding protein
VFDEEGVTTMSRNRSVRAVIVLAALTLLVVASASAGPAATSGAAQSPRPGGTFTIGLSAGFDPLDPATTSSTLARLTMKFVYDTLLYRDPKTGRIVGGLASSYKVSKDGKMITLRLRRGVRFHDGTPFNAQAVVFSINRILDPKTRSPHRASIVGPVRRVRAMNPTTLRIVMNYPFSPFLDTLTQQGFSPVSPTAVRQWGANYSVHPVGTGPFMVTSVRPGDRVTMVRNPNYNWAPSFFKRNGRAYLSQVVVRVIPEDATRMALGRSGDIDLVYAPIFSQLAGLRGNPQFRVRPAPRSGVPRSFIFNTSRWPFDDPRVRQAVAHAINKQQILAAAYGGNGSVAANILSPGLFGYSKDAAKLAPKFNPARARTLLTQAGWRRGSDGILVKDGQKFSITYGTSTPGTSFQITSQIVQSNLKDIGIETTIQPEAVAAYLEDIRGGKWHFADFLFAASDPDVLYTILHSSSIGAAWNTSRYRNARLDSLLLQARQALTSSRRVALYKQIQELVMRQLPYVPYYNITQPFILNSRVRDLTIDGQGFYDIYNAWVSR